MDYLPSLVIVDYGFGQDDNSDEDSFVGGNVDDPELEDDDWEEESLLSPSRRLKIIGLAHFSIKEFPISDRIKDAPASSFSVDEADAHIRMYWERIPFLFLIVS
jgi:hypothetical protein